MHKRNMIFGIAVLVVLFALAGSLVSAEPPDRAVDAVELDQEIMVVPSGPETYTFQYMVKFVCGFVPPPTGDEHPPVKPGNYATAINIGHPGTGGSLVPMASRVLPHYSRGEPYPAIVKPVAGYVARFRVLEIDCNDIWAAADVTAGSFLKGMVHVGVEEELEVVAVFTAQTNITGAGTPNAGAGISIDVEYIGLFQHIP